jgi:hypothetical protein
LCICLISHIIGHCFSSLTPFHVGHTCLSTMALVIEPNQSHCPLPVNELSPAHLLSERFDQQVIYTYVPPQPPVQIQSARTFPHPLFGAYKRSRKAPLASVQVSEGLRPVIKSRLVNQSRSRCRYSLDWSPNHSSSLSTFSCGCLIGPPSPVPSNR